jgi:hypothetical protein
MCPYFEASNALSSASRLRADVETSAQDLGSVDAGERRQLPEHEVHPGDGARAPVMAQALDQRGTELPRVDHAEQRTLRVGVRDDGVARNLGPVLEQHARCLAVEDGHARHRRVEPDDGACLARRLARGHVPSAPGPPFTLRLLPAGDGSSALCSSRTAPVPADLGPAPVP